MGVESKGGCLRGSLEAASWGGSWEQGAQGKTERQKHSGSGARLGRPHIYLNTAHVRPAREDAVRCPQRPCVTGVNVIREGVLFCFVFFKKKERKKGKIKLGKE